MMHLPPQAYTKETLIQAYNWLRSQPAHVQELAKSPDALVALYTRAQIHGENYLSRTNLQGFKSELKNLASMMGDFDDSGGLGKPSAPPKFPSSAPSAQGSPSANPVGSHGPVGGAPSGVGASSQSSVFSGASNQGSSVSTTPSVAAPTSQGNPQMGLISTSPGGVGPVFHDPSLPLFNAAVNNPPVPDLRNFIDARSWTMIQEVKNHFNLSSETEAIRLLVVMGYQKMRSQF